MSLTQRYLLIIYIWSRDIGSLWTAPIHAEAGRKVWLLNSFWSMFTSWRTDSMRQSIQENAACQLPTIHCVSTTLTFQSSKCRVSTLSVPSKHSVGLICSVRQMSAGKKHDVSRIATARLNFCDIDVTLRWSCVAALFNLKHGIAEMPFAGTISDAPLSHVNSCLNAWRWELGMIG